MIYNQNQVINTYVYDLGEISKSPWSALQNSKTVKISSVTKSGYRIPLTPKSFFVIAITTTTHMIVMYKNNSVQIPYTWLRLPLMRPWCSTSTSYAIVDHTNTVTIHFTSPDLVPLAIVILIHVIVMHTPNTHLLFAIVRHSSAIAMHCYAPEN